MFNLLLSATRGSLTAGQLGLCRRRGPLPLPPPSLPRSPPPPPPAATESLTWSVRFQARWPTLSLTTMSAQEQTRFQSDVISAVSNALSLPSSRVTVSLATGSVVAQVGVSSTSSGSSSLQSIINSRGASMFPSGYSWGSNSPTVSSSTVYDASGSAVSAQTSSGSGGGVAAIAGGVAGGVGGGVLIAGVATYFIMRGRSSGGSRAQSSASADNSRGKRDLEEPDEPADETRIDVAVGQPARLEVAVLGFPVEASAPAAPAETHSRPVGAQVQGSGYMPPQ